MPPHEKPFPHELVERCANRQARDSELRGELPPLAPEHDLAIYRTAQEGLTNVARHASASLVAISLVEQDGAVELSIRDDGEGVDPQTLHDAGGIGGMRERARLVGGQLTIERSDLGGTEVRLRIPAQGAR